MSIQLTPEHEARIKELARQTGRDNNEVLGEVIDSYFRNSAESTQPSIAVTMRSRVPR